MTTILVTGGCGYVGSRIALKLSDLEFKVVVADKATPKERNVKFPETIEFRHGDLRDIQKAHAALKNTDYVLHLAANIGSLTYMHEHQAEIVQENSAIDSTLYPLFVSNGIKGIVYSSTSMVFQHPPVFPYKESDLPKINPPTNIYGFSKLLGEYFCRAFRTQHGLNSTVIRYHNIYGPGEDSKGSSPGDIHVIPALLEKILVKKQYPIELLGNPNATRSFVFIDDAVCVTIKVMEQVIAGNERVINNDFNIGNDKHIKIIDLAGLMWKMFGDERPFKYTVVPTNADTAIRREVDIRRVRDTIGWEPKTPLEEGIKVTADWIKTR